jgi:hypothetical protein
MQLRVYAYLKLTLTKGGSPMVKNERGSVIIMAMMLLAALTIIGIAGVNTSTTEVQISTNALIYNAAFYAADSGPQVAKRQLLDEDFLPESSYGDPGWVGTGGGDLDGRTRYDYEVVHQVNSDGEVLRYGDPDGNHLWEINTISGRPLEFVVSHGTHIGRGGNATVEATMMFRPGFEMPGAALWVDNPDLVDFQGNATVEGDAFDLDLCADVPDVLHDTTPLNPMDEPAHYGDEFIHEDSNGMYPFGPVYDNLSERADYIGTEFPTDLAEESTLDNPVVIIIEGDLEINNADLDFPANGILYVNGDLRINGNVEWNGVIITTGDASVGNGTADINGALITGQAANVDISGTITIQYDCTTLQNLFDWYSGYKITSWKQL